MNKKEEKALLHKAEHIGNRIKETVRGNTEFPDVEKIYDFEGMSFVSWGQLRRFTIERATKLQDHKEEFLRDLGLELSEQHEDVVVDIELYLVDNSRKKEVEYFVKSERRINQSHWRLLRKVHDAQILEVRKEFVLKYLEEESLKPQPFSSRRNEPDTNFFYRSDEYLLNLIKKEKKLVKSETFHPQDYDSVRSLQEEVRDFHFTELEKHEKSQMGNYVRIFELVIVEKGVTPESVHMIQGNYYVPPMSPVIEDSYLNLPNLYDSCWREAKSKFQSGH